MAEKGVHWRFRVYAAYPRRFSVFPSLFCLSLLVLFCLSLPALFLSSLLALFLAFFLAQSLLFLAVFFPIVVFSLFIHLNFM